MTPQLGEAIMKERWDIELLFLDGPLADNRPRWFKGPTIQIGTDPEIGGVKLPNRNLDKIHAVIDCYDGRRVAPIQRKTMRFGLRHIAMKNLGTY